MIMDTDVNRTNKRKIDLTLGGDCGTSRKKTKLDTNGTPIKGSSVELKPDLLENLEAKTSREQEEILLRERRELEEMLRETTEQLNIATEKVKIQLRETELLKMSVERIQKGQSTDTIKSLQAQLESVSAQLQSVETEKSVLLECLDLAAAPDLGASTSGTRKDKVDQIMESEMQCSICGELFIEATTLGCSHSFCKYCISTWMRKKKECPICRTHIRSECPSLAIDSFINQMMEDKSEEVKKNRREMAQLRQEEMNTQNRSRRGVEIPNGIPPRRARVTRTPRTPRITLRGATTATVRNTTRRGTVVAGRRVPLQQLPSGLPGTPPGTPRAPGT